MCALCRVPTCAKAFGCVFHEILNDDTQVYVKLDDDIIFIKDGAIEHLAYQALFNKDYAYFSGAVVNNPHAMAIHRFIGAYPPETYHWRADIGRPDPPFYNHTVAPALYYGGNLYDTMGSEAHQSFIYNIANNRMDMYGFDVWNMNQCQCGKPQEGLVYCIYGNYRWNVNAIAWVRDPAHPQTYNMETFDEL